MGDARHAGEGQLPVGGSGSNVARGGIQKAWLSGFLRLHLVRSVGPAPAQQGAAVGPPPPLARPICMLQFIFSSSAAPWAWFPSASSWWPPPPSPWYFSQTSSETSCTLPARTSRS